jgi:hypothetical protein
MNDEEEVKTLMNPRHRKRILTARWEIIIPENEPYVIVRPRIDRAGSTHNLILRALLEGLKPRIIAYNADSVEVEGLKKLNLSLRVGRHRIDAITFDGARYDYWEVKQPYELGLSRTQEQLLDYARNLKTFNLATTPDGIKQALDIRRLLGLDDVMRIWEVRPRIGDANALSEVREVG